VVRHVAGIVVPNTTVESRWILAVHTAKIPTAHSWIIPVLTRTILVGFVINFKANIAVLELIVMLNHEFVPT
jgi:hypothetical protein